MSRRKIEDRYIRNLTKVAGGNSYVVTIPIEFVRKLKWKARQRLEVTRYQDRIVIRDWKK